VIFIPVLSFFSVTRFITFRNSFVRRDTMEPHSIQIINSNSDNTITLDDEALRSIFARDEIKDRYVSVISVTGVFRQGKSFLLNFLLRYLRMKVWLRRR
jgi:hypothetical protein